MESTWINQDDNFAVTTLIGDDDTTTMANVHQSVSHTVQKSQLSFRHLRRMQRSWPPVAVLEHESFNNTVERKAPKARYYSGSESLDFHVKAATCQKM